MQAVLRALDALDLEAAVALFAPDGSLMTVFGETASGRDRVREVLGVFLQELRGSRHELTSEWNPEQGIWVAEMSATYELTDYSRRGPYARVIVLRAGDGGIDRLDIYGAHEQSLAADGRHYVEVRGADGWLPTL
jgi:SnoaL-like domain